MKTKLFFSLMLSASVLVISCKKGDTGPQGSAGQNGTNGQASLVRTTAEAAGANCATGGAKVETGLDANNNGVLDNSEVVAASTRYICNGTLGATGTAGQNGKNSLTKVSVEPVGGNCTTGGVKIEVGADADANGVLDASEIVTAMTRYICNGTNGTNGTNGLNSLVRTATEPAGANCTYGGTKFEAGLDANNNGTLEDIEVATTQTKYVCNGAGAVYSNWIDINLVPTDGIDPEELNFPGKQNITSPNLTADVVDKGVVLMYYKNSRGTVFPVDRDDVYALSDEDANGIFYLEPGFTFKVGSLKFLANADLDRINASGSVVRYVIIPGLTQGRTIAGLKKMSYQEIVKLYNIKD